MKYYAIGPMIKNKFGKDHLSIEISPVFVSAIKYIIEMNENINVFFSFDEAYIVAHDQEFLRNHILGSLNQPTIMEIELSADLEEGGQAALPDPSYYDLLLKPGKKYEIPYFKIPIQKIIITGIKLLPKAPEINLEKPICCDTELHNDYDSIEYSRGCRIL